MSDSEAIEVLRPEPIYEVAWRCGGLDVEAPCGCWHRFFVRRYGVRHHLVDGVTTLCDNDNNCAFTWKGAYQAARQWVDSKPKELEDGEAAARDAAGVDGAAGSHRC